ncbi:MAG TPA: 30S ribosomal protein S5 [Candidatus Jacksonbacteria bacterium]|nr:30S ribosomal protein S5 [Candidatus Jacksonbacteria bacterium]HCE86308.1 30S ribosomal protein S5 [Candidatus Jacksonbacteria bacterium]
MRQSNMRGAGTPDDGINSVILDLARVTRVQKGGKRLRFRICVGIGDKKGKVGIALAKGADVQIAVEKATRKAKKDAITLRITENGTIPHIIDISFKAARILLKPAPPGTGIKAGGVIRTLCDLAGIQNITAKMLGNNNKITNAQAFIRGFQK